MKLNKLLALAIMVIASMGLATGTAYAAPAPAAVAPTHWNVLRHGAAVTLSTDNGTFAKIGNQLQLRDAKGLVAATVPLTVAVDDWAHPVDAQVSGKTVNLRLDTTPLLSRFQPIKRNVDLSAAVAGVKDNITLTAAVGGFVGAAAGLVGGCVLGAIAAGVVSAPAALLFGAGPLAGCVGGALLLGSGASLAGTAIGGLGAVAANVGPFIQLLNQPPKKK